jgi:hypothetical protein
MIKDEDKLQMYHSRQFCSLVQLVEEWIKDWTIGKSHPMYLLYKKNEKLEKELLEKISKS